MRIAFLLTLSYGATAQINWRDSLKATGAGTAREQFLAACPGWTSHGNCNVILNSQITTNGTPPSLDPFSTSYITGWEASHGTPQLNIVPPDASNNLPPGTNAASMWATTGNGEGIVGNIPAASPYGLNPGTPYLLSFYRRVTAEPANPATRLDNFEIALIKCADRSGFPGSFRTETPAVPADAQIIYCESFINIRSIPGYQRIVVRFVPNDQYNLIWIYPQQGVSSGQAWLHVALPQIFRADLAEGPWWTDDATGNYYLGYRGGPDYQPGYTELCHEINTKAEWFGPAGNLLWSYTVLGSSYNTGCPYATPCPATYGPVPLGQAYTFKQTFLQTVTPASNTCSDAITSRTAMPFQLRMATNPSQPPAVVAGNTITKDAAHIRFDADNNNVVVRAESVKEQPISMVVYDMQGRSIKKYNGRALQGTSNHTLPLPGVAAGVYFANVQLGANRYSFKFNIAQ